MNKDKVKFKVGSILILIILICSGLFVINHSSHEVTAVSVWKQQSDIDFENGTLNDISITGFGDFSQLVLNNNYDWAEKLPPINTNPMARNGHDMASIDGDDKVVLFGGSWGSGETWVYDLSDNNWTEKTPATGPDIRKDHAMASVDGTDNVVFFGGWNGTVLKNDTWVYDLSSNTWTQKFPANPPDIRLWHSMATIYGTDKVLLFGGYNGTDVLDDTWEYDLSSNTWTNKYPSGSTPGARVLHALASIDGNDRVVLFGGVGAIFYSDTWVYDLSSNAWTLKSTSSSPTACNGHGFASIRSDDKVVLFGGWDGYRHLIDTWVYDLSGNNWVKKSTANRPINRSYYAMASFDGTDQVVIFGGNDRIRVYDDTWIYDLSLNNWIKKLTPSPPYPRNGHVMATVYGDDKVVLFGGYSGNYGGYLGGTWVYDLSDVSWTRKYPANKPYDRLDGGMATIYNTDKMVLFGGSHGSDETWVYDVSDNMWIEKKPPSGPSMRRDHSMATIYGEDKVLLFGGWDGTSTQDDTWVYDLSTNRWTDKNPSGNKPIPRAHYAITGINGDDKVVLFGGYDSSSNKLDDTWVYDLSDNKWTQKTTTTKPSPRVSHAMVAIQNTKKVMMYGGFTTSQVDDTWVYDLRENTWTQITMTTKPLSRSAHDMAEIQGTDKIVVFGGYDGSEVQDDTWVFGLSSYITPGTFVSNPFYFGENAVLTTIAWNASTSATTEIKFKLRTSTTESALTTKNFIGPDGTTNSYYTDSPSDIWSGHNGDSWVQYKVYFSTTDDQDTPRLESVTISYDVLPITTLLTPGNGTIISNNKPIFVWNFYDSDSTHQTAFQVLISNDDNFQNVIFDSQEQDSMNQQWSFPDGTSYSDIPDGTWYWKVRTKDSDDAWGAYSTVFKIIIDTTAPSSETLVPCNNGCFNNVNTISGLASDPTNGTGINKVEISIKRVSDNYYWDDTKWGSTETWLKTSGTTVWSYDASSVTWSSGSEYIIKSRSTDNASNVEDVTTGNKFIFDTDAPVSRITSITEGSYLNNVHIISGSATDTGGMGIGGVELCIRRTGDYAYWDGKDWKFKEAWLTVEGTEFWHYNTSDVKWSSDSHYIIRCRATDKGGNIEGPEEGITFMFDDKPPSELAIIINNEDEYTTTNSVELSIQAVDSGSGISEMAFSTDGKMWTDWEEFQTSKSIKLPGDDEEKTVFFKVRDLANNEAESVSDTIILDTTPPEDLLIRINNDNAYTTSKDVVLNLYATDSLSGIFHMSFSTDGTNWKSWEQFATTKSFSLSAGDGERIVYFRVLDSAGNIAESMSDSIILDTTPPESLSIVINGNALNTNFKNVTLTIEAIDLGSGVDEMSFSLDGVTWTTWEEYSTEASKTLPDGDGEKDVYLRVKDAAGNIAEASDSIILDTTPPHSLSLSINGGASKTDSTSITLNLNAADELSKVSKMSFSTDGKTWTDWEDFETKKSLKLPSGDGEKTIYFRVMDSAGNTADPVKAKIELDQFSSLFYWSIAIIVILVIILIIAFVLIRKRKKDKQQVPTQPYIGEPIATPGTPTVQYIEQPPPTAPPQYIIEPGPPQAQYPSIPQPQAPQQQTWPATDQITTPSQEPQISYEREPATLPTTSLQEPTAMPMSRLMGKEVLPPAQPPPIQTMDKPDYDQQPVKGSKLSSKQRLELLEKRYSNGEISEETYLNLKNRYSRNV